ncbi:MAG: signal peptidase II [Fidelibacterota bacterium]
MNSENKRYLTTAYLAGAVLLVIDLVVKYVANQTLLFQQRTDTGIKWLSFYLTHNTGYHYIFGEIKNHKLWSIFGLIMLTVLLVSLTRSLLHEKERIYKRIYTVILMLTAGAGGNVLEILFTGKATDFFVLEPFPWPSNICDQYINAIIYIVMPVMLITLFINRKKSKQLEENGTQE